ncbi:hypothetical protein B0H66DRAFT_102327 [Apodospora peruviana]|uniref:Uncharacterized protein n=1 Tax=Apodospora peruviana TaxID=516989 RepID=A0AAE0HS77_9PEZI|nr:hypothetical protein B0H66DRAFT_102327 [Apodospora peruviana]
MMLPPVEAAVLQNNPDFAALYTTLTTVILNPDGSTKNNPTAKERKAIRDELDKHRLTAAKQHLLTHAITTANPTPSETSKQALPVPAAAGRRTRPLPRHNHSGTSSAADQQLPPALLDLLLLLPPLLSPSATSDLPEPTISLLLNNPPFSLFPSLLPTLTAIISTNLHASAVHLARLSNPSTNPSFIHRTIPSLPTYATNLLSQIQSRQSALTKCRLSTASSLGNLLAGHSVAITHLLRSLESKHGPIARSLEFRAVEMALNSQKQEQEVHLALWQARRDTYSPEAVRALGNYMMHLRDAKARLAEGVRNKTAELEGYGVSLDDGNEEREGVGRRRHSKSDKGKERTMREMARVYREMGRQVEEVRGDLERLGRA